MWSRPQPQRPGSPGRFARGPSVRAGTRHAAERRAARRALQLKSPDDEPPAPHDPRRRNRSIAARTATHLQPATAGPDRPDLEMYRPDNPVPDARQHGAALPRRPEAARGRSERLEAAPAPALTIATPQWRSAPCRLPWKRACDGRIRAMLCAAAGRAREPSRTGGAFTVVSVDSAHLGSGRR